VSLRVLLPNASQLSPVLPNLPLGSLLVLSLDVTPGGSSLVKAAHCVREQPWCPLIVPCAEALARDELAHFVPLPASVTFAGPDDGPDEWRARVVARPDGGHAARLAYLGVRLRGDRVELIRAGLEDFTEGSSIRRRLRRARLPAPHAWRDLCAMCDCLSVAIASGRTQAEMAAACPVSVTTLSRRCQRLFGATWPELCALGTWEAVIECALRHLGVTPPLPPAPSSPHAEL